MITESTTLDADAEVRHMIATWTDSLLRLRSRPAKAPPRGQWRFAATSAWDSKGAGRHAMHGSAQTP